MILRVALLGMIASLLVIAGCGGPDVPSDALEALTTAEQFELLSLDPERPETPPIDEFRGWRVLGRTTIGDAATRKKLTDALRAGAREKDISPAACFDPRHGVRVTKGGSTTDFVICFACSQAQVFVGDQKSDGFLVSHTPEATFDAVLRDKSVPLPSH